MSPLVIPSRMNLEITRDVAQRFGLQAAIHDLAYRAVSRLADGMLLDGLVISLSTVDRSFLERRDDHAWGLLDRDTLLAAARAGNADLSEAFIDEALGTGDECFGLMEGGTLVSYGWYSTRPTRVFDGLLLRFNPAYAYMYKGFTLPAHRGKRLHGIGMALALETMTARGRLGLVSWVQANNFSSLRSCRRMGYRRFGQLAAARINGCYVTYATKGCAEYDFRLEAITH